MGERQCIDLTRVDNSYSQGYSRWKTNGGENTSDYLFFLSYAEAKDYYDISIPGTDGPARARIIAIPYAVNRGAYVSDTYKTTGGQMASPWWLRSPGFTQGAAACVHSRGCLGDSQIPTKDICVRPAMWIDLTKVNR